MKLSTKLIIGIAALSIIGFAGFASAHGGYGGWSGHHMGYGMGYGYHMGFGPHMGYYGTEDYSNLSNSDAKKIDKAREEFFKSTEKTREDLYENRIELRRELAKTNPDTGKLKTIQKKISKLEAELDQKTLDFEVKVNKIAPNARSEFSDRDFRRGGYCWQ